MFAAIHEPKREVKTLTSILCSIPNPNDTTSLYRSIGPLQTLARKYGGINLGINPDISWSMLKACDLVFFQRPFLDVHLRGMKISKVNNKPVWIDYDDYLHAIPICNKRFPMYGDPQVQNLIAQMIAMADLVTVSTDHLKEALLKILSYFPAENPNYILHSRKIMTIPNAYDPELHGPIERTERAKKIIWRGSDSHSKDLLLHTKQICNIVRDHPDWEIEFIGEPFWLTMEEVKKVAKPGKFSITASMDPIDFFRYLKKQKPTVVIVPLEDIAFNRSKSNIAWIEATMAGAVTLAPAWPEWQKPGVITYEGPDDFEVQLRSILKGDYPEQLLWEQSRDYITDTLSLDRVNEVRHTITKYLPVDEVFIPKGSGVKIEDIQV